MGIQASDAATALVGRLHALAGSWRLFRGQGLQRTDAVDSALFFLLGRPGGAQQGGPPGSAGFVVHVRKSRRLCWRCYVRQVSTVAMRVTASSRSRCSPGLVVRAKSTGSAIL